jgi:hypothetical protein
MPTFFNHIRKNTFSNSIHFEQSKCSGTTTVAVSQNPTQLCNSLFRLKSEQTILPKSIISSTIDLTHHRRRTASSTSILASPVSSLPTPTNPLPARADAHESGLSTRGAQSFRMEYSITFYSDTKF